MDVTIYRDPNPAITTALTQGVRPALSSVTNLARDLLQAQVAKRTGRLASSIHASVEMQSVVKGQDRLVGTVTMGGDDVDYALPYQFGSFEQQASHDMNIVLEQLQEY